MTTHSSFNGKCSCGHVQYEVNAQPIIVHCCHCTWCQRESGSAFAVNAVIETSAINLTAGECELIDTPSQSGKGQQIARCPKCHVALWSHYNQAGPNVSFIRVGTLEQSAQFPPDIHIYTSTKLPWVVIPEGARTSPEFYNPKEVWSAEGMARIQKAKSS